VRLGLFRSRLRLSLWRLFQLLLELGQLGLLEQGGGGNGGVGLEVGESGLDCLLVGQLDPVPGLLVSEDPDDGD